MARSFEYSFDVNGNGAILRISDGGLTYTRCLSRKEALALGQTIVERSGGGVAVTKSSKTAVGRQGKNGGEKGGNC